LILAHPFDAGQEAAERAAYLDSDDGGQLSLLDARTEAALYHRAGPAFVAYCYVDPEHGWRTEMIRAVEIPELLRSRVASDRDGYLSIAQFTRAQRRVVNLATIGLGFVDLDTYRTGLSDCTETEIVDRLLAACTLYGVRPPSLVLASGRGFYAKWIFSTAIDARALVRWQMVEEMLIAKLSQFGADSAAKDGARVLRLVGTTNTKSGAPVRVIYETRVAGEIATYDFEDFSRRVLPADRDDLRAMRLAKQLRLLRDEQRRPAHYRGRIGGIAQLNHDRLADIRLLAHLRGWTRGAPSGFQDLMLFLSACALAPLVSNTRQLRTETAVLGREFAPTWRPSEHTAVLSTLVKRAEWHYAGETVTYRGREVTPIYTYRTSTLLGIFEPTAIEQREMRTLFGPDERRRRDVERHERARRAAGADPRDIYLATALDRRQKAREMAASGRTQREIAAALGVTQQAVSTYLRADTKVRPYI
jgi:DNA-binding CsgD family transcriptional regulator